MRPPFPGMDPWLEHPAIWPDVHSSLITAIRDVLSPRVAPRYYVGVEQRLYRLQPTGLELIGRSDVTLSTTVFANSPAADPAMSLEPQAASGVGVLEVMVPMKAWLRHTYLEVHDVRKGELITTIEILSPTNKKPGPNRRRYIAKRQHVFESETNLVEIDLLRDGPRMPLSTPNKVKSDYRILISRGPERPLSKLYYFGLRDAIPNIPIPLRPKESEPELDLGAVLHALYDRARFDLRLDYGTPPVPPLNEDEAAWAAEVVSRLPAR